MIYYYTFSLLWRSLISLHWATSANNEYNRSAPKIIARTTTVASACVASRHKKTGPKAGGRLLLDAEFFDVASLLKVGFEPIGFWPFC